MLCVLWSHCGRPTPSAAADLAARGDQRGAAALGRPARGVGAEGGPLRDEELLQDLQGSRMKMTRGSEGAAAAMQHGEGRGRGAGSMQQP